MKPSRLVSVFVAVLFVVLLLSKLKQESTLVGAAAPDFVLPLVAGEGAQAGDRVRLADLKGKFLVLDFWASWCGPCRESAPILSQVARELSGTGVQVYGINTESLPAAQVAAVASAWSLGYPVLQDMTAETQLAYDVSALPTLVLIDRAGVVRRVHAGSPSAAQLITEIRALDR